MIFSNSQIKLLRQLEFSREQIINDLSPLDKESFASVLRRQKKQLSLRYHPDRNNGDEQLTQKFLEITHAYDQLIESQNLKPSILDGITPLAYEVPIDCLDFKMEEAIDDYFETITHDYLSLATLEEKQQFVKKNEEFLQFIVWFTKNRSKIHEKRQEAFYQFLQAPSLGDTLYRDWNTLVVQLFAEENLDDITYREAMALGEFSSILATRKLVSPIKWFSLGINGAYNVITAVLAHFSQMLIRSMLKDLEQMMTSHWSSIFPLLLKLVTGIAILTIPCIFLPQSIPILVLLLLSAKGLFYLANPINQIIRPLADYFKISPLSVGIILGGLGITAVAGLTMFALSSSLILSLLILADIATISGLVVSLLTLKKLYEINPAFAVVLGFAVCCSTGLALLFGAGDVPAIETLSDALLVFFSEVGMLGFDLLGYKAVSSIKEQAQEVYGSLPFPEQQAPEVVKHVIDTSAQNNNWSHRLFNTPVSKNPPATLEENSSYSSFGFFGQRAKNNSLVETSLNVDPVVSSQL